MSLPDFALPSSPEITVRLREATVSDAIEFSEIDKDCEEEAISAFLERLQLQEKRTDPRLWTGEDRRYALFTYLVNTTKYPDIALTYHCDVCDKNTQQSLFLQIFLQSISPWRVPAFASFRTMARM